MIKVCFVLSETLVKYFSFDIAQHLTPLVDVLRVCLTQSVNSTPVFIVAWGEIETCQVNRKFLVCNIRVIFSDYTFSMPRNPLAA